MFNSLSLLRSICSHDLHIRESLFLKYLNHMFKVPQDNLLHGAWLWLELLRSSKMLVWPSPWHLIPWHILFLPNFVHMSIVYILKLRDMKLRFVPHFIMPYRAWLMLGWSTCLNWVWQLTPCLHILLTRSPFLLVFSRLMWMLKVLMGMEFWDLLGWVFRSIGMGTSLYNNSVQSTFQFDYGHH